MGECHSGRTPELSSPSFRQSDPAVVGAVVLKMHCNLQRGFQTDQFQCTRRSGGGWRSTRVVVLWLSELRRSVGLGHETLCMERRLLLINIMELAGVRVVDPAGATPPRLIGAATPFSLSTLLRVTCASLGGRRPVPPTPPSIEAASRFALAPRTRWLFGDKEERDRARPPTHPLTNSPNRSLARSLASSALRRFKCTHALPMPQMDNEYKGLHPCTRRDGERGLQPLPSSALLYISPLCALGDCKAVHSIARTLLGTWLKYDIEGFQFLLHFYRVFHK